MKFDEFIAALRAEHTGEPVVTGFRDSAGVDIRTGDIVVFWSCLAVPYSTEETPGSTEMVGVVEQIDGEFYVIDHDTGQGAFLWRVDRICTVVGHVHGDTSALKRLIRFKNQTAYAFWKMFH